MTNGTLVNFNASFLLIGTSEISNWTDGKPFIVPLETEDDFSHNGLDYADFANMKVGEMESNPDDYEGIYVIRMK